MPHDTALTILGQTGPGGDPRAHPFRDPSVARAAGRTPPASLYIHVPFCFHKCHYCDFYSIVDTQDRQGPFVKRLVQEFEALGRLCGGPALETIFVGGGTPSLLRPDLWEELLASLRRSFDLSPMKPGSAGDGGGGEGEFTVECNPETVTPGLMSVLAGGGVNRVSMGAQSFHADHLRTLERWHDPENVPRALEAARVAGIGRASIDLIFGVPGQTLGDWERDLERALSLGTGHLSCYGLTYEPGTAMTARLGRGEFSPADEEVETGMFLATVERLSAAGMPRYEVSNFARPGEACRHNMVYWRQGDWLAAGPSASAHLAGRRWKNIPRLGDYLAESPDGLAGVTDHEAPDAARNLIERIMTGLRLTEGLDGAWVLASAERARPGSASRLEAGVAELREAGVMGPGSRWNLTDAGFLVVNRAIVRLMECFDQPGSGGSS
ncbi:MAG: radical SAM family heme chaperone HemW [Phycisphaeraceae bacterium]|nr:MAG: radical SAM family heme chaperone HemW [Phycisphaeraceae bacterium]